MKPGADAASFDASINLADLELPPKAKVFVEAHYKSSYQRFDFGTVDAVSPPAERTLDEVDRADAILFRVKVVDTEDALGRLVAEADDLSPDDAGDGTDRYCILLVNFVEMGEQLWRLDVGEDRPMLCVNKLIPGAAAFVKSDPVFVGLVYPEVVRQVLKHIVLQEEWAGADGLSGWREMWIRFARLLAADEPPAQADEAEREEWIEDVVCAFCERQQLRTRLVESRTQERA
jgi:hypothetical protein